MKFTPNRRTRAALAAAAVGGIEYAAAESSLDKSGMARIRRHHQRDAIDAQKKRDLIGGLGTVVTGVGQALGLNQGPQSDIIGLVEKREPLGGLLGGLLGGSSSQPAQAAPASSPAPVQSAPANNGGGNSAAAPAQNTPAPVAGGSAAPVTSGDGTAAAAAAAPVAAGTTGGDTSVVGSPAPVIMPDGTTSTPAAIVPGIVVSTPAASSAAVGIIQISDAISSTASSSGNSTATGSSSSVGPTGTSGLPFLGGGSVPLATNGLNSSDRTANPDGDGSSSNTTKIVVPIVVVVAALALVAFIVMFMRRRRRMNDQRMQPMDYSIPETVGLNTGAATSSGFPAMGGGAALAGAVMRSSSSQRRAEKGRSGESWVAGRPMSPAADEDGYSYDESHAQQQLSEHSHHNVEAGAADMYTPYPAEAAITTPPALQPGHPGYGAAGAGMYLSGASAEGHGSADQPQQMRRQSAHGSEDGGAGGAHYATASEESYSYHGSAQLDHMDNQQTYDGSANYGYSNKATKGLDQAGAPGISPYNDLHRPQSTSANTAYGGYAATDVGGEEQEQQRKRQSAGVRSEHSAAPSVVGNQYDGADVGEDPFTYVVADQSAPHSNSVMQNAHLNSSRWSG